MKIMAFQLEKTDQDEYTWIASFEQVGRWSPNSHWVMVFARHEGDHPNGDEMSELTQLYVGNNAYPVMRYFPTTWLYDISNWSDDNSRYEE